MGKGQDAAGIIVIDEERRVLLVHQTYGKKQWSVPGGMVEEGESAWDAASRELKEEINISVSEMELAGLYFQPHKNRLLDAVNNTRTVFREEELSKYEILN